METSVTFHLGSLRSVDDGTDTLFNALIRFARAMRDVRGITPPTVYCRCTYSLLIKQSEAGYQELTVEF